MKRRDFLQKTLLASGALALPAHSILDFIPNKRPEKVIVIGAGFSGLAAAHSLRKAGVQVTVLESRSRIGGRVFSHKPVKGSDLVIEFGAEWVGNSHERILSLCKEFGLSLFNNQFETHLSYEGEYSPAGKWDYSPEMTSFWDKRRESWGTFSDKDKEKIDQMDWWRFLSQKGFSDRDLDIRDLLDSTDFGECIRQTSAFVAYAEYAESSDKDEMDQKIRGGNGQLAEKLADAIGREFIHLSHTVGKVEQTKKGVRVLTTDNKEFIADQLICTVPTYSLMKIDWQPGLPKDKVEALLSLQYARIGKYPVIFSERFWKQEDFDMITDSPAHYFYHATKNQTSSSGILTSYATGDKGALMASQKAEKRLDIILDALKPAFGDVRKYVTDQTMYYWGKDKYSYGAYANYGPGQWFSLMPVLHKAFGPIHFAGEHLADWQGFMEGAINSGEEAAEAVLS
ncbi:MAG: FAD-dependent oxidoreductase [Saprospiraceae bacterium]